MKIPVGYTDKCLNNKSYLTPSQVSFEIDNLI